MNKNDQIKLQNTSYVLYNSLLTCTRNVTVFPKVSIIFICHYLLSETSSWIEHKSFLFPFWCIRVRDHQDEPRNRIAPVQCAALFFLCKHSYIPLIIVVAAPVLNTPPTVHSLYCFRMKVGYCIKCNRTSAFSSLSFREVSSYACVQ